MDLVLASETYYAYIYINQKLTLLRGKLNDFLVTLLKRKSCVYYPPKNQKQTFETKS